MTAPSNPHAAQVAELDVEADRKRFEHLRALLALRDGHQLYRLADGAFMAAWRGLTRDLPDLDAVETFARQIGALR